MATVLCLGVPAGARIGIDLKHWVVGRKFHGITGISRGPHYLYYAADGRDDHGVITSGRFLFFEFVDDIWVGEWCTRSEQILPFSDRDQADRYRQEALVIGLEVVCPFFTTTDARDCQPGVRQHDFDFNLGRYPEQLATDWASLCIHISKGCIKRLAPIGCVIHPSQAPGLTDAPAEMLAHRTYYTDVKVDMPHSDPAQVTSHHMDKSQLLEHIVELRFDGVYDAVLGELQFAFIAFMLGHSYEGFEQWKALILILCSCDAALWDCRHFFEQFIEAFSAQMRFLSEDFFASELTSNNFLYRALTDLFELGQETSLETRLGMLKLQCERQFHWHFGSRLNPDGRFDSDDEDAPVVVDLS